MPVGFPPNDHEYQDSYLKTFEPTETGYVIGSSEGWSFHLPNKDVTPQIGQTIRCYGRGFGYAVRGVFLDGQKVFYKTEAEEEAEFEVNRRELMREKEEAFAKNKDDMDRRFAALPEVFQRRIQFFRDHCPKNFRVEYEPYELFTCEQAVAFASRLKTPEEIRAFHKASCDEQKKLVPEMDEGHSGNTFGCACMLATHYVTTPENVFREHGAMVPLVGCREYGCLHGEQYGR